MPKALASIPKNCRRQQTSVLVKKKKWRTGDLRKPQKAHENDPEKWIFSCGRSRPEGQTEWLSPSHSLGPPPWQVSLLDWAGFHFTKETISKQIFDIHTVQPTFFLNPCFQDCSSLLNTFRNSIKRSPWPFTMKQCFKSSFPSTFCDGS